MSREKPINEWISVDERLPEKYGKYLVFKKGPVSGFADLAYYDPSYAGHNKNLIGRAVWFMFDNEWGDYEVNTVTHWTPLPEAPKIESEEWDGKM